MYICNCNALNERQVRVAIDAGAKIWTDVHAHYGVSPQCGSCGPEIAGLLNPGVDRQELSLFAEPMVEA